MHEVKPCTTPAPSGQKLSLYDGEKLSDPSEYRSVEGALQYLTLTRPDISYSVNQVCDPDNRQYTGGYCVYLGPNLISWSSKTHKTVSRSSAEAEYHQLAFTAAEISWLRSMFCDLSLFLQCPTIWCDNLSAIAIASNPVFYARTKHVEVDYDYVREKVVNKELQVLFVSTTDQVADIFTKGLSSSRFQFLVSKLPVLPRPLSWWGSDKPIIN